MKATDLRIGNLLEYAGQPVYVLRIQQATEFMGDSHHLDLGYYTDSVGFERHENDQDLRPLPLTEEWLIRFRFEKSENSSWMEIPFVLGVSSNGSTALFLEKKWVNTYIKTEYVHQLQNLYFALTGQELTLSPPHI